MELQKNISVALLQKFTKFIFDYKDSAWQQWGGMLIGPLHCCKDVKKN